MHHIFILCLHSGRRKGFQPCFIQIFAGPAARFVDLAHRHHQAFADFRFQFVQFVFRGSQTVNLFTDGRFVQRVLPSRFRDEIRQGGAGVAVGVCQIDFQRITHTRSYFCRNGYPLFIFLSVELPGISHQPTVQGTEDAVVQPHAFWHINLCERSRCCLFHYLPIYPERIDNCTYTAANLYPKLQPVSRMDCLIQFHHRFGTVIVQFLHAPDQHPPVIGTAVAHHQAALMFFQIGRGEIPVKNLLDVCQILCRHFVGSAFVTVHGPAVRVHNHRHVFRPFHAAFNLIRDDAGFNHLRQNPQCVQILRA